MAVRLAHLADLHFGEDRPALAQHLAADIRAQQPHAIVVSGDLTRRARPDELAAAFAFLNAFGLPVMAVPGNHDIPSADLWARLLHPRRAWQTAEPPPSELRIDDVAALGLDTTARGQWHLDWSAGAVPPGRRTALAHRLAAARPGTGLVVCHHPLRHPPGMTGRRPPRGAGRTLELLARAGVRALLCGHLHRAGAQVLGAPWPVQLVAPSALSPRGDGGPNGWNVVDIGADGLRARVRHFVLGAWVEADLVTLGG
jgi:3',5'-cyclic AMP phosphodiesterase CpdA